MHVRAYLRASTKEQDARRPQEAIRRFAAEYGHAIAATYAENATGAAVGRPELVRLLADANSGDVLLVESIDRLSRLPAEDWQHLKAAIDSKGLRIVAMDLPTSYQGMKASQGDEFTDRMLGAINSLMIEMSAAIARKDYEQRRERQAQGIEKARAQGKYKGRSADTDLHRRIRELLAAGLGIRATARHAQCSTTTVLRVRKAPGAPPCIAGLDIYAAQGAPTAYTPNTAPNDKGAQVGDSVGHPTDRTRQRQTP